MATVSNGRSADLALVQACVRGDGQAWLELVETYETTVYYAVRNTLRARGRASPGHLLRDLQSEIFYRIIRDDFRRLRQYQGRASLKHWLKVVANNFVLDYLRKYRPYISLDAPEGAPLALRLESPQPLPDYAIVRREAQDLLLKLLSSLKPADREFFSLYYEQELPFDAVARAMKTSVAAVYSRKKRVTSKLQSDLERRNRRLKSKRERLRALKCSERPPESRRSP